jgi:hypothetical protein
LLIEEEVGMIPYTFKVRPLPRIYSHDSAASADELNQLIDATELLSDLNYTRFSQLDNLWQGILYDNWHRLMRSQPSIKFDEFLTKKWNKSTGQYELTMYHRRIMIGAILDHSYIVDI